MPITDVDLAVRLAESNMRQLTEQQLSKNGRIRKKSKGELNRPYTPNEKASEDFMSLIKKSVAPFVETIVSRHAEVLQIDGYPDERLYAQWKRSSMAAKQDVVNQEALLFGYSYLAILPDEAAGNVVFHHLSARTTHAVYADDFSVYPTQVLQKISREKWFYLDDEITATFTGDPGTPKNLLVTEHGLGYTPVVRIEPRLTPASQTPGSPVEGLFAPQDALNDSRFSLNLVARRMGFPQKWATGVSPTAPDAEPISFATNTVITDESPETKFGQFQAADIGNLQVAVETNLHHLAFLANVPPHHFSQSVSNLSAEALASLEMAFSRRKANNQQSLAVGYNLAFATAADIIGVEIDPADSIHWQDLDSRSLSQTTASIELLIRMGYPEEDAFRLLPGITQTDALNAAESARSKKRAESASALIALDTTRLENAKRLTDLGYSKEEALEMAGYRTDAPR